MDVRELATLVRKTRQAQRDCFRSKSPGALEVSKRPERELDRAVKAALEGPGLFDAPAQEG